MFTRRWSSRLTAPCATLTALAAALLCAGASWGASRTPAPTYDPSTDPYSVFNITAGTGAQAWWNAGYTGKGIDVAVIDTGVSPVGGLSVAGKVVNGPDLSLESQAMVMKGNTPTYPFRNLDSYGHGTFMAGLVAGRDSTVTAPYANAPATAYRGMAPDARIVSLKVGTADGGTDVSQVIAAIDWVVQHGKDPGFNIRVISLSYGTNTTQSYLVDPLAFAAEQAWKKGIVVVAAAGNAGYQKSAAAACMASPAFDPYVIAVAGADTMGTRSPSDDVIGDYSSSGANAAGCKAPDFAAPGSHVQGLRVPGSYIDENHPEGVLGTTYFRGSGTSEATAIVSGAVALVLQKYPSLTPDQVKQFFAANAGHLQGMNVAQEGAGEAQLAKMLTATPSAATQAFTDSTGTGSLESSRGSDHLTLNSVVLTGEKDIFGKAFVASSMANAEAAGNSWSGGTWNGSTWSGNTWSGNTWSGSTWSGNSWSGNTWSGMTWSGNSWSGNSWSGNSWSGNSWSGARWSGNTWSGGAWKGATWD